MSNEFVIVTRHSGAVAWLAERGITGEVIAHAAKYRHVVVWMDKREVALRRRVTGKATQASLLEGAGDNGAD